MTVLESLSRFIGWWVIHIDATLFLMGGIGGMLYWRRHYKKGRKFYFTTILGFLILGFTPCSLWLFEHLENRFPKQNIIPQHVTGMILLGGTNDQVTTASRNETAYNLAGGRLIAFVKLIKQNPHLKVVFTGRGKLLQDKNKNDISEANLTRQDFEVFGIDTSQMIFENKSLNTIENTYYTKDLVQPKSKQTWLLVTSAFHMPRAVGLFRKAGWNVIPYPVDYHTPGRYEMVFFMGLGRSLLFWYYATGEWMGMVQNYLYHRSDHLFPNPN